MRRPTLRTSARAKVVNGRPGRRYSMVTSIVRGWALLALVDRQLQQRGHFHEGAQHAAVQGRQVGVADQVARKGQDGRHLVARANAAHSEESGIGNGGEKRGQRIVGGEVAHGAGLGAGAPASTKAPCAVAIGSSGVSS